MNPPAVRSGSLAALPGIQHAFFTRAGGVSQGLYASLNLGAGSADDQDAVAENRRRAAAIFDATPRSLTTCYQVHSNRVVIATDPWDTERPRADGVVTGSPGLVCAALSADCAPILMADATARIVAAVHAGWRGALGGVVEAGVAAMTKLGAEPRRIVAAIGPCIGPTSYEVGPEFVTAFENQSAGNGQFFVDSHFDLPGYVLSRLALAGVGDAAWVGADTFADEAAFFSNRRAVHRGEGDYGRMMSAIMLANPT